jgi:hypothetical protein
MGILISRITVPLTSYFRTAGTDYQVSNVGFIQQRNDITEDTKASRIRCYVVGQVALDVSKD